jgi:hypothetical protein
MTAGVLCAASSASAQYYPYAAPAMLPAPQAQMRPVTYAEPTYAPPVMPEQVQPGAAPVPQAPAPLYDSAMSGPEGAGGCDSGLCGEDFGMCGCGCGPSWYASFTALYMTRNKPNPYQVSFDTTNPVGELILNTNTIDDDWQPGFQVSIGKYLGCSSAVEFSYWTLDNFGGQAYALDPPGVGSLNTPFDFRSLNFGGVPVTSYFDNAQAHRLTRNDEFHNFEVNFIHWPMTSNPYNRVQASGLVGFRYINFRESWQFATSDNDPNFGVDPTGEAYYDIDTTNNLFGVQVGGRGSFGITDCLSVYAAPRFGVFANYMEHTSRIYSGDGQTALNINSNNTVLSLLGQLDVGVNYQITSRLSIYGGYRVVAISGIALADNQIPYLQDDLFGIGDIDHNSNLVLHGATGGLQFNF